MFSIQDGIVYWQALIIIGLVLFIFYLLVLLGRERGKVNDLEAKQSVKDAEPVHWGDRVWVEKTEPGSGKVVARFVTDDSNYAA